MPCVARLLLVAGLSACLIVPSLADESSGKREKPDAPGAAGRKAAEAKERRWQSLFDGKTLAGWHPIGKGQWTIEDGVIVGRHDAGEKEYGHLVSDKSYKDFTIRLKFRSMEGNSGLYFRVAIDPKAFSGLSGFQAEIDPKNDVGGLYETNGRAWVVQPTPEQVKTYFKPGEWNEMTVTAKGRDVTVTVNGTVSAQLKDDPGKWTAGPFALQVHGGQDVEVWFKDVEILEEGK